MSEQDAHRPGWNESQSERHGAVSEWGILPQRGALAFLPPHPTFSRAAHPSSPLVQHCTLPMDPYGTRMVPHPAVQPSAGAGCIRPPSTTGLE